MHGSVSSRAGRRGLLNMNFDSGLPKTFLRTLFADNSPLIFKVACAWSGSPQPFRQMFCLRTLCWPSTLPNNFCLGNEGQREERNRATPSVLNGRGETAALTCADLRQSLTPTAVVRSLTVLKYLQLYFTSWSLP